MPLIRSVRKMRRAVLAVAATITLLAPLVGVTPLAHAAKQEHDKGDLSTATPALARQAKAAVLMDAATGKVLFAKNEHEHLPIASVTKIATMLLTFEALDRGQVKLQDPVRTSDYAASMGGSQIFLEPGEKMSLAEMLKGIAVGSANDAAVAVAEHVAGSEAQFVQMMNQRVSQLHLKDTHFANVNGLPVPNHYSSAYDLAILSRELLKHEQVTTYTGLYSDHLRKSSANPFWLVNTNKLIRFYPGMDGLKTGFTAEAKYCLAASAKRDHLRMIAVVLGEPTSKVRNAEVTEMMNYAFSHYQAKVVYAKGQTIAQAPVAHGQELSVPVAVRQTAYLLASKVDNHVYGQAVLEMKPLKAPVRSGQQAGVVKILSDGAVVAEYPVVTTAAVQRVTLLEMLGRAMRRTLLLGADR